MKSVSRNAEKDTVLMIQILVLNAMILRVAPVTLITPLNVKNVSILHFCMSYNVLMNVQLVLTLMKTMNVVIVLLTVPTVITNTLAKSVSVVNSLIMANASITVTSDIRICLD
jgi:hypothetical protein